VDWRLKCLAFHLVGWSPSVHSLLQRTVTGRYFRKVTPALLTAYGYHLERFQGGRALEFGAGPDLICPLLLSHAGADEVLAYDLNRLATPERVNAVVAQLRDHVGGPWPFVKNLDEDLIRQYRIRYLAPADARQTGLPRGSIDFVCSTSVLEHIPPVDIAAILAEMKRVAKPMTIHSAIVDYHDHYATADPGISQFHFYRYSAGAWRWFNPGSHFQNRLRHSDYLKLFADYEIVEARAVVLNTSLDGVVVAPDFRHYSQQDLLALNGFFALRNR